MAATRKATVNTYLDPTEVDALDALCEREDRTRSDVLRRLVRRECAEHGITIKKPAAKRARATNANARAGR